jgi:CO/xanthine dehydrogenase Mo-binding subunit
MRNRDAVQNFSPRWLVMGTARQDVTAYAFGAHFVEVRVHSRTCEIRVPRVVSAFAAGTIINPLAAHRQLKEGLSVRQSAVQAHRIFWHGGYE